MAETTQRTSIPELQARPKKDADAFGEGIPVRQLTFSRVNGLDFPGTGIHGANGMKSGEAATTRDRFDITFHPRVRAFRIVWTPANIEKAGKVFLLHESWALAELE